MGLLVARIKILPQDVAIKPDQLLKDISDALLEGMAIRNSTEEPIAFGLVALIADIKFEDKEGSMEELENFRVHTRKNLGVYFIDQAENDRGKSKLNEKKQSDEKR